MDTNNSTYHHHSFAQQDLSEMTFTSCTFIRCDFRRSNLRDATFINCKFIEQGDIEGCRFDVADLRDASFQNCQLAMANFSNANCYGIELRDCDLKGANFTAPISLTKSATGCIFARRISRAVTCLMPTWSKLA